MELIIGEQMNKYRVRLKDISSLEFAENKAKCRLTLIRRSMVSSSIINIEMVQAFKTTKCGHRTNHSPCFSIPESALVTFCPKQPNVVKKVRFVLYISVRVLIFSFSVN